MDDEALDAQEPIQTDIVNKADFAAVPIHFRPAEGKSKLFKLVIPGIEPPLGFYEVTGDSADQITIVEVQPDETDDTAEPEGEVVEVDSADQPDQDTTEEVEEVKVPEHEDEVFDEPEVEEAIEEDEPEEEGNISSQVDSVPTDDYPYSDDAGNPVAGFLVADSEDADPLVITVRPEKDESIEDAMKRVQGEHDGYSRATLDEAIVVLGHNPLTAEDN